MNRRELRDDLEARTTLPARVLSLLEDGILEEMTAAFCRGEQVLISGFGTFILCDVKRRPGSAQEQISAQVALGRYRFTSLVHH